VTEVVSIHSFRGGTGKSNVTANLAATLARSGKRVGIIDTDVQSPGIHALFGLTGGEPGASLNDFLAGRCTIGAAAVEVGSGLPGTADGRDGAGRVYLVPSSMDAGAIAQVLREGYDVSLLAEGIRAIGEELALDALLIDTHPGLNEETLLAITLSSAIVVLMRPDRQDFQGTAVTVEVARKLGVPRILLVANKVPPGVDREDLGRQVASSYDTELVAALPHSDSLMAMGSAGVLCHEAPGDDWSAEVGKVAAALDGAAAQVRAA
jgi:MinD-like ATPase involved in chromosome partitioning or flagellar assembly